MFHDTLALVNEKLIVRDTASEHAPSLSQGARAQRAVIDCQIGSRLVHVIIDRISLHTLQGCAPHRLICLASSLLFSRLLVSSHS